MKTKKPPFPLLGGKNPVGIVNEIKHIEIFIESNSILINNNNIKSEAEKQECEK